MVERQIHGLNANIFGREEYGLNQSRYAEMIFAIEHGVGSICWLSQV